MPQLRGNLELDIHEMLGIDISLDLWYRPLLSGDINTRRFILRGPHVFGE